jgi:hypothetical protein
MSKVFEKTDILQDKIYGNKYKCFYDKCRKTFQKVSMLLTHQKNHVSHYTFLFISEIKKTFHL